MIAKRAHDDRARGEAYFRHGPDDRARIEAYRIRNAVAVDGMLGLRPPGESIDATAVAIELTMRDRAGLPHWIRELDAPAEYRNPDPWDYCPLPEQCSECKTALAASLPASPEATRRAAIELALLRLKVLLVLRPAAAILRWLTPKLGGR